MITVETVEAAALKLAEAAFDVRNGRISDALTKLSEVERSLVGELPVDALKDYLTDRDRRFADMAVDVAEAIKVDG